MIGPRLATKLPWQSGYSALGPPDPTHSSNVIFRHGPHTLICLTSNYRTQDLRTYRSDHGPLILWKCHLVQNITLRVFDHGLLKRAIEPPVSKNVHRLQAQLNMLVNDL